MLAKQKGYQLEKHKKLRLYGAVGLLVFLCCLHVSTPSKAEIADFVFPVSEDTLTFNLGVIPQHINSISFSASVTAEHGTEKCCDEEPYCEPGYCCTSWSVPMYIKISIGYIIVDIWPSWQQPGGVDGPFEISGLELCSAGDCEGYFANGSEGFILSHGLAAFLFYGQCFEVMGHRGYSYIVDPGLLEFSGDIVISVDYDDITKMEATNWGALKSRYR